MGSIPGHMILDFLSPQERKDFVEGPSVWWYQFAEEISFEGRGAIGQRATWNNPAKAGSWTRGGAWEARELDLAREAESDEKDSRGDLW